MIAVQEYCIPLNAPDAAVVVEMPLGSQILSAERHGYSILIRAKGNPKVKREKRFLRVVATDAPVLESGMLARYIGSVLGRLSGSLHIFEEA